MKKWKIIVPIVVVLGGLGAASPKLYSMYIQYQTETRLQEEYDSFLAVNAAFYDNSFFNGIDISRMTPDQALATIEEDFESKTISIKSDDASETDSFSYTNLTVDYKNLMKEVLAAYENQKITLDEYANGSQKREYSYDIEQDVDFSKLDISNLNILSSENKVKSEDAYVSVDKLTGNLQIVDEVYGNEIKEGALEGKIEAAVLGKNSEISILPEDYVLPSVLSTDSSLEDIKAYYEVLLNKSITINVCGMIIGLSPSQTVSLYDFEPGDEIDEDELMACARSLKNKYDTYHSTRTFLTTTGETVSVVAGDYGWAVDVSATAEAIRTAAISDKSNEIVEAVYSVRGQRPANAEIGNTYVEIDLRDQKIWMYVDGVQIVNDDITSGMLGDTNSLTRTGTYSLAYKQANVTLKGPTWNDFVYYWMPYDLDNAVGMHDATWRTDEEFGGTNRYGNGSHGCVNCRLETAAIIYNNIQMDTPIIVWE